MKPTSKPLITARDLETLRRARSILSHYHIAKGEAQKATCEEYVCNCEANRAWLALCHVIIALRGVKS